MNRFVLVTSALLAGAGCVSPRVPPSGTTAKDSGLAVADTAAFDHGCPAERVRIIRADSPYTTRASTVDLDVCGTVRRYKVFKSDHDALREETWVDVTSLYPASTLPPPLPAPPP